MLFIWVPTYLFLGFVCAAFMTGFNERFRWTRDKNAYALIVLLWPTTTLVMAVLIANRIGRWCK